MTFTAKQFKAASNKCYDGCSVCGWKCCNPFNCDPRKMKHLARRIVRRKMRRDLVIEVQEALHDENDEERL